MAIITMRIFIILTIFFLPFTNLFSLGAFSNVSFIIGCSSLFFLYKRIRLDYFALALILILILIFVGDVNSLIFLSDEKIAFVDVVTLRLFVFYFLFLFVIYQQMRLEPQLVFKCYIYAFYAACIYGLIDFMLMNLFNIKLDEYFYRFSVQENSGTISNIIRNRSFFSEPGHFAFYLNSSIFFILAINKSCSNRLVNLKLALSLYFLSILTTFSAAGIVF
ncbi:hypothetical protein [Photobacterium kishitanii]|uniref:hypothetical protein n=1 Tax=Photobacterium kishitanii TaxID=318456 RepID=UPI00273A4A6E|nr:hypothetical protein [Photobacterium kishitanii]